MSCMAGERPTSGMVSVGSSSSFLAPFGGLLRVGRERATTGEDLGDVEGLWQVFVGAKFAGADGGHERVLRAHNDDRHVGPQLLDRGHDVEGVAIWHGDVSDQQIALARLTQFHIVERFPVGRTS